MSAALATAGAGDDVARLLAPFPHVRLATRADDAALSALHRGISMESGPISLAYDYRGAPLDFAAESGSPTFVPLFEQDRTLYGTASLACRRARLGHERVDCAYLANLRIAPGMPQALRREWRDAYAALACHAASLDSANRPRFLFTSILDDNGVAVRFLTRHLKELRYVPLQQYTAMTVLGPLPGARREAPGIRLRFAGPDDLPRVREHLDTCGAAHGVGEDFTSRSPDELTRRFAAWRGFGLHNFVLAEDAQGELMGTMAPRIAGTRRLEVTRAAPALSLLGRALSLLGRTRLTLPGPLEVVSLTHLELHPTLDSHRRRAVLEAMLAFAWEHVAKPRGAHALEYAAWPQLGWPAVRPRRWLTHATRGTLYQVIAADGAPDAALVRAAQRAPLPFDLSIA